MVSKVFVHEDGFFRARIVRHTQVQSVLKGGEHVLEVEKVTWRNGSQHVFVMT
jgi:hypothetical protein